MKVALVLVCLLLAPAAGPLRAQQLCAQCLNAVAKELHTCLDSAISREDKESCQDKHATKAEGCREGECLLEQAAKPGNTSPTQPAAIAGEKASSQEDRSQQ